jgi:hypothetical protein
MPVVIPQRYQVTVYRKRGTDTFVVYDQIPKTSGTLVIWVTCDHEIRMYPSKRIVRVVVSDALPTGL